MSASAPAVGGAQRATPEWLPEIVAFADSVFRPTGRGSMADDYPCLFDPANAEHLFVRRERGRIVALVGALGCQLALDGRQLQAASIGSVATAPDRRGRGAASALLALAERELRAEGCRLLLISGERGLYERFGAVRVGSVRWYRLERPLAASSRLSVTALGEDELAHAARLYDRRGTRYVRTLATLERLFCAAGFAAAEQGEQRAFLAADGADARAYAIVVERARHYPGLSLVTEWAGDADALIEIFDAVLAAGSGAALLFPLLAEDDELAKRLPGAAALRAEAYPYTAKVIDGVGLWEDLARPGGLVLTGGGEGLYALAGRGRARMLTAAELTSLLFAAAPPSALPPPLAGVCPFPFVWPQGLNYV